MELELNESAFSMRDESKYPSIHSVEDSELQAVKFDPESNALPPIHSEELLRGRSRVMIQHGDQIYILLCTRNNRLILIK